jgi:hypothetical protein
MELEVQDVDDQEKEKTSVGSNPGYENVISEVRPNAQNREWDPRAPVFVALWTSEEKVKERLT